MKVIFLDIDGVLNSTASRADGVFLEADKLIRIRNIAQATNADVIITSSWRALFAQDVLAAFLTRLGLNGVKIGYVSDRSGNRAKEIEEFVAANPVEGYVILDDENFGWSKEQDLRWIACGGHTGLLNRHVGEAIKILNMPAKAA